MRIALTNLFKITRLSCNYLSTKNLFSFPYFLSPFTNLTSIGLSHVFFRRDFRNCLNHGSSKTLVLTTIAMPWSSFSSMGGHAQARAQKINTTVGFVLICWLQLSPSLSPWSQPHMEQYHVCKNEYTERNHSSLRRTSVVSQRSSWSWASMSVRVLGQVQSAGSFKSPLRPIQPLGQSCCHSDIAALTLSVFSGSHDRHMVKTVD